MYEIPKMCAKQENRAVSKQYGIDAGKPTQICKKMIDGSMTQCYNGRM